MDRWRRINEIFDHAIGLAADARAAYLDAECADDPTLRAEVARLLDADAHASGFIERPVDRALERMARSQGARLEGRRIGAWRVINEIGRGGMGTVWLGERADGEFDQRVAIKMVHPGMGADWVVRRFQAERRILASLEHANIARLLDGGTTEEGAPYFVMEFIEGTPIVRFCDEHRLDVGRRLELFRDVCAAVAYAHQRLVIHRDIKPSNVLVTNDGVVKLLDFGIATILHDVEDGTEARTVTAQHVMTPEYASPEQVEGAQATTLSDVYSLGVMLYELLCGRLPYRFSSRSIAEVARVIRETKAERPSTALTSIVRVPVPSARETEGAEGIGAARGVSVEHLRRRLRGDLDTIVLKAIQTEPGRRYASAEQFSEDIRRHLVGLPVHARPDTVRYRVRKFIDRNRIPVAAAVLAALALVGGAITTAWQAKRAREAQARAERRFDDLRKLARAVLFDYHDAVKDLAGSTPVRERLVADGLEYLDGLAREAGGDASLQRELAEAYVRVGDVQGGVGANLGNTAGAIASYRKASVIYADLVASDSSAVESRSGLATTQVKLLGLLPQVGETREALECAQRARQLLDPMVAASPTDSSLVRQLGSTLANEGTLRLEVGEYDTAVALHERYLAICEANVAKNPALPSARYALATANAYLAVSCFYAGDYERALAHNGTERRLREEIVKESPLSAVSHRALYVNGIYRADILARLGRPSQALENLEQALSTVERLLSTDPQNESYRSDRGHTLLRMGDALVELGTVSGSIARYQAALEIRIAEAAADTANLYKRGALVEAFTKLARARARLGEPESAMKHARAALDALEAMPVDEFPAGSRAMLATRYAEIGDTYSTLARRSDDRGLANRELWGLGLAMYERSAAMLEEIRARKVLSKPDEAELERVGLEIERCRLAKSSSESM